MLEDTENEFYWHLNFSLWPKYKLVVEAVSDEKTNMYVEKRLVYAVSPREKFHLTLNTLDL